MRRGARLAAGAAFVAVLGAIVLLRLEVTADVTHFLPEGNDVRLARLSRALATSELARTMVLVFEGADGADRAEDLTQDLGRDPRFERVVSAAEPERMEAIEEALWRWRYQLAEPTIEPPELVARLSIPQTLEQRERLKNDPIGAWEGWQRKLAEAAAGGLTVDDAGRLVTADGAAAVAFLRTAGSPLRFEDAAPAVDALADVDALRAGAHFHAVGAERAIRADVRRIGLISALAIVLLFGAAFRSLPALMLAFLPSAIGVLAGLCACLLLWGRVHGLTLAFGASLLGVCVDYPVHLLSHHRRGGDPEGALRHVRVGLLLGAGTTVAGFTGLVWTSFPGIREIAVFAGVGVAAALLVTLFVVPALLRSREPAPVDRLASLAPRLAAARLEASILVVVAVGACAWFLPRLEWDDTLGALAHLDPDLVSQEERIQAAIGRDDPGRMVVVFAEDVDAALSEVEEVCARLEAAEEQGELGGHRALTHLLPSEAVQLRRRRAIQVRAYPREFEEAGLSLLALSGFLLDIELLPRAPLRWRDVADGPVGELLRPHVLRDDQGVVVLTYLRDLRDASAVAARLTDLGPDVALFDQAAFLDGISADYRTRTSHLLLVGLFAVTAMLLLRYRRLRPALAALLPALLAAGTSLALLAAFGVRPHLLHLASTLLVLSIGVDFGVFLVEHRASAEAFGASLRAIVVAAGTTVLSFGALAISSQPSLRAIGTTAGLGVLLALVFAPVAVVVMKAPTSGLSTEQGP